MFWNRAWKKYVHIIRWSWRWCFALFVTLSQHFFNVTHHNAFFNSVENVSGFYFIAGRIHYGTNWSISPSKRARYSICNCKSEVVAAHPYGLLFIFLPQVFTFQHNIHQDEFDFSDWIYIHSQAKSCTSGHSSFTLICKLPCSQVFSNLCHSNGKALLHTVIAQPFESWKRQQLEPLPKQHHS